MDDVLEESMPELKQYRSIGRYVPFYFHDLIAAACHPPLPTALCTTLQREHE